MPPRVRRPDRLAGRASACDAHLQSVRGAPVRQARPAALQGQEASFAQPRRQEQHDLAALGRRRADASLCATCVRKVRLPELKKDEWLAAALQAETKYCRLVWRQVGKNRRYYVQLVQKGLAPIKASLLARLAAEGTEGGLDIGPSNIAWATGTEAGLFRFCADVDSPQRLIGRLQRKLRPAAPLGQSGELRREGPRLEGPPLEGFAQPARHANEACRRAGARRAPARERARARPQQALVRGAHLAPRRGERQVFATKLRAQHRSARPRAVHERTRAQG